MLGCATGEDEDLKVQRGAMTVICRGKLRGNYMQGNRKSGTDAGKKQLSMASACQKGGGGRGKGGWVVDWTKVAAGDFFIFLFLHCCCIVPSPAHITRRAHTDSSTLIPRRRNQSPSSIS